MKAKKENGLNYSFPENIVKARLAYAQSFSLLGYIIQEYGKGSLNKLIKELGKGQTIDMAMYKSTGKTLTEIINDWKIFLKKRYKWTSFFPTIFSLWFVMSILVIFPYIHKRHRNAQKIKEWEEEGI